MTPLQDVQALADLFGPRAVLSVLGIAFDLTAFMILAFDIRRIHNSIGNRKTKGYESSELAVRKRMDRKYEELYKWDELSRGKLLDLPVDYHRLQAEWRDHLALYNEFLNLIEATRFWPLLDAKVTTKNSLSAMGWAAAIFGVGIAFQLLALVPVTSPPS